MPRAQRARNYCFTWNNYTSEDEARIAKAAECTWFQYCIYGKEVGENGTPHLQGYLQLKSMKSIKQLKKSFGDAPHWEVARGSLADNQYYCDKDKDFTELGTPKKTAAQRGAEPWEAIRKMIKEGDDYDILYNEIADAYPSMAGRYYNAILKWIADAKADAINKMSKQQFEKAVLREWQKELIEKLEQQNEREIYWVYDEDGNTGKTFLAKWLHFCKDAFYFENAKKADIACAWQLEEYAVCNLTRDKEGMTQYSIFESLKDGMVFSAKYESKTKVAPKPVKLVIMSNWLPDVSTMSMDRWKILQLNNEQFQWWTDTQIKNLKSLQNADYDNEKECKQAIQNMIEHHKAIKRKYNAPLDEPPAKRQRITSSLCQFCVSNNCNIHRN